MHLSVGFMYSEDADFVIYFFGSNHLVNMVLRLLAPTWHINLSEDCIETSDEILSLWINYWHVQTYSYWEVYGWWNVRLLHKPVLRLSLNMICYLDSESKLKRILWRSAVNYSVSDPVTWAITQFEVDWDRQKKFWDYISSPDTPQLFCFLDTSRCILCNILQQGNSVAQDLPGSEANTTNLFFIYIGYRFPLSLSTIVFLNKKIFCFLFPEFIFSRNVGNSIKCKKNITPPPQTTPTFDMFEIKNQNKGIGDIIWDIDCHCPYLLFGATTSHLISKWRGTFQY